MNEYAPFAINPFLQTLESQLLSMEARLAQWKDILAYPQMRQWKEDAILSRPLHRATHAACHWPGITPQTWAQWVHRICQDLNIPIDHPDACHETALGQVDLNLQEHAWAKQVLVECGANPNAVSRTRNSILSRAGALEEAALFQSLLAHGADPSVLDSFGRAALHIAVGALNPQMIQAALDAGADLHQRCQNGMQPIDYLWQQIASRPTRTEDDWSAEQKEAVRILIDAGADVSNVGNRTFRAPLLERLSDVPAGGWLRSLIEQKALKQALDEVLPTPAPTRPKARL